MNVVDLAEILRLVRIDPAYYSLDGERHEALCLESRDASWQVFLSERGDRYEGQHFDDEDSACVYFLKRLLELAPALGQ